MGYKKHNWVKYGNNGRRAKIEIYDEDNRVLDKLQWNIEDKNSERVCLNILKKSHGINFKVPKDKIKSLNNEILKKDIEW